MSEPGVSAGEVGGVVAGGVAILGLIGGGIKWAFDWKGRREDSRAAKLQAWHDELDEREKAFDRLQEQYRQGIEARLKAITEDHERLKREHIALRTSHRLLFSALQILDPANPALRMADQLLRSAFPVDPATPADMTDLTNLIP